MILPNFPGPSLGDIIYRIALSIFPVARISFNVDPFHMRYSRIMETS